jgi:hypothetical protein
VGVCALALSTALARVLGVATVGSGLGVTSSILGEEELWQRLEERRMAIDCSLGVVRGSLVEELGHVLKEASVAVARTLHDELCATSAIW